MSSYYGPSSERSPSGGCGLLLGLLILACIGGVAAWQLWPHHGSGLNPQAHPRAVMARGSLSEFEKGNIEIYEQVSPCLAQVTNLTEQRSNWFSLDVQAVPKGVGSGFVWDQDGHVVTNYHVVKGADAVQVTLADHSTYTVSPQNVWVYEDQDMAVIFVDAPRSKLHPIMIGTSKNLKVGQLSYALGDPFGLDQTMTMGIVSALNRTIDSVANKPIRGVIQTSAAINPGNSGGPLLDSAGRLIGMNTAIVSPSGGFAGIGFAIPVDEINRIVPELIAHGKVVRPRLGVQLVPEEQAHKLGVKEGALILKVVPKSPAEKADLRGVGRDEKGHWYLGDIIVALDGQPIKDADELYSALQKYKVGDTVTLTIIRDSAKQDVKVTLGATQ